MEKDGGLLNKPEGSNHAQKCKTPVLNGQGEANAPLCPISLLLLSATPGPSLHLDYKGEQGSTPFSVH